jgi:uncharacterized protein (DUF1330 family)
MKTEYAVAIATFAGIAIGGVAVQALQAQTKPRAYVVIEIDVMNQEPFFKEFVPAAVKIITEQGGKFLTRGGRLVNIEGPAPVSSEDKRLTMVEFDNMEKAQATFASPSYNDVRNAFRKGLSEVGIIDGQDVTISANGSADPWCKNPIAGGCCGCAGSGHAAAAPPSSVMKSRRFTRSPRRRGRAAWAAGRGRAPLRPGG